MAQAVRHIEESRPKKRPAQTRERAEFDSSMKMVQYAVDHATAEDAPHFFRRLREELAYLCRQHGFKLE